MSKLYYFKVTFLPITVGFFVELFVYGLFDVDFSNGDAILKLFLKSLIVGVVTGLILGILNMCFKISPFPAKRE